MTIEHRIPRSIDDSLESNYSNCLLACRFCNRSRSNRPARLEDHRLLDPTRDSWAEHFALSGDEIVPVENSVDASYTLSTYDLNDERKVKRRRDRRLLIEDRLNLLALQEELDQLLKLADRERTTDLQAFSRLLRKIKEFRDRSLAALSDLARYAAVPHDAPASCRCGVDENHTLPDELARQTLEVPGPSGLGP